MATFITAQSVGQNIQPNISTSTGYWKYNHNGSDSSVFSNGSQTITVANANGEFTIIPCLSDGTVSGNITQLYLSNNQLTSFDGTGLSSLTFLNLDNNQFTSFDGTGLTSLNRLSLRFNQLTSFDGTGLTSLTELDLGINQLTSLSGFIFPASLTQLSLNNNQFTSFDGTGLPSLTGLILENNQLTSFDGTDLSSLIILNLVGNQLTSFDGTGLTILTQLYLSNNQLTSFDGTDLSSLTYLSLGNNQLTPSDNDQIINQLNQNGLWGGEFYTNGGRTWASNVDYDNLISSEWSLGGLDLVPTFITAQSVGQDININVTTSTGHWKYYHNGSDSSVFSNGSQTITVANANGEFTIIPCLSNGTVSGDITQLDLSNNQIISFDGTGLTSLNNLFLGYNQLTTIDVTGLTSLNNLGLGYNQLTTIDVTVLTSLTSLSLDNNQLTTIDVTGLINLNNLDLSSNQLTSFDGTGLTSLTGLYLGGNQLTSVSNLPISLISLELNNNLLTPSSNNQILNLLDQYGLENGEFYSTGGRTSAGTADYDALIAKGWTLSGLDLPTPPTFITSKSVGQNIQPNISTSTGYWKYNHNGSDSSVFSNGYQTITLTNANGEFTIIPCLSDGTVSGDITQLYLNDNQITSFDGAGLTSLTELLLNGNQLTSLSGLIFPLSLTYLDLNQNQLTSFDGTGLTSLTELLLNGNQLTSFDGTGLISLTSLELNNNQFTSFDGTGLTSLVNLYLENNQITSFDGTGLSSLSRLYLNTNQLTSFDGTGLTGLTFLNLSNNQLTSFDTTDLTSLTDLSLGNNQLTSFDGTGLTSLVYLSLMGNQLTSLDVSSMSSLINIYLADNYGTNSNPITPSANDSILNQLVINNLSGGGKGGPMFSSANGRTATSNVDYNTLLDRGWNLFGLDLVTPPPSGNGKLRIKGVNSGGGTTTTTTTEAPTTTTTTTTAAPSYMFSIPQPDANGTHAMYKFGWSNIITTSGYWKFVRINNDGVYTSSVFGNVSAGVNGGIGYGNFTIISCDVNGNPSGTITYMNLSNLMIDSFNVSHPDLSGLTRLSIVNNSITSLDVSSLTNLDTLFIAGPYGGDSVDSMTPQSNTDILLQLNANGLQNGTFTTNGGRVTSQASESAYLSLINKGWTLLGLTAV